MRVVLWCSLAVLIVLLAGLLWLAREVPVESVELPPDATAVLADPRFAEPVGWTWRTLTLDEHRVRWGVTRADSPRAVVLFLPGYSAPLEIYFETFSRLREAGYTVVAMDWPGQGGSSRGLSHPQKIHATSLDDHVRSAIQILQLSAGEAGESPLLLVSLSMGAQLGARAVAQSGDLVDAAALVTPAFGLYDNRPTGAERALLAILNGVGLGERYAPGSRGWQFNLDVHFERHSDCSHPNARTKLWYAVMVRDPLLKVGGMTNAFVQALVKSAAQARADETLGAIKIPVWMPLAEADTFVSNSMASQACERLNDCELRVYEQARHCLFEESDRYYQPFIEDLLGFLDRHDLSRSQRSGVLAGPSQ